MHYSAKGSSAAFAQRIAVRTKLLKIIKNFFGALTGAHCGDSGAHPRHERPDVEMWRDTDQGHYESPHNLRGRIATFPGAWQTATAAWVTNASVEVQYRRKILNSPVPSIPVSTNTQSHTPSPGSRNSTGPCTVEDIQARYGALFTRAMRTPVDAMQDLVEVFRPRPPRTRLSPECRSGLALRYLEGGSYVATCAARNTHPRTTYRALLEVDNALNGTPSLAFAFGSGSRQRRFDYADAF